jgi:hypothetical protein
MGNTRLGLNDLVNRGTTGATTSKLMNVKVPSSLLARLDALAVRLRAKKTEVVIALLNEGLENADKELQGWKPPPKAVVPKGRRCRLPGCDREKVAKGLCATHYQAQRRANG